MHAGSNESNYHTPPQSPPQSPPKLPPRKSRYITNTSHSIGNNKYKANYITVYLKHLMV